MIDAGGARASLLVAAGLGLAGCASPEVHAFALTAPAAPVELVPVAGDLLPMAWTYDADQADAIDVVIEAVPTTAGQGSTPLAWAPLTAGAATFVVPPDASGVLPLPPGIPLGVYQVRGHARDGADELASALAPGLVIMQGAAFRAADLRFTGADLERDIWMTTVTATVARAVVSLQATGGARYPISDATIASDLAPVGRVITFTGRTIDDQPIPAGDYAVEVEMHARGNTVTYRRGGLTLHWLP